MYISHKCLKCSREFILLEEDLQYIRKSNKDIYIVCPYCSSRKIIVSNKYNNLKECMDHISIYKRINGRMQQIK